MAGEERGCTEMYARGMQDVCMGAHWNENENDNENAREAIV